MGHQSAELGDKPTILSACRQAGPVLQPSLIQTVHVRVARV